jgi:uncharacterized protein (DUF736 family)
MSEEYDNTNRGAAFPPFDTQKMILQGKLDSYGNESRIVLVRDETRSGKRLIRIYEEVGVLFPNKNKEDGDKRPDYTGNVKLGGLHERFISAWKKLSEAGNNFMSLSIQDKRDSDDAPTGSGGGAGKRDEMDDEIPF